MSRLSLCLSRAKRRLSHRWLLVALLAAASPAYAFDQSDYCADDKRIRVLGVGDVLLHRKLQVKAYSQPDGARAIWREAEPLIQAADIAYANLEGPTAAGLKRGGRKTADPGRRFDDVVYSSFPSFNYHPALVGELKQAGFDIVSTANNHALDRWAPGVDATITELERHDLAYTGTRRSGSSAPFHRITRVKGANIAWLACTYSTNGIPDRENQVLGCYSHKQQVLDTIAELKADPEVDAVIVTPHWGVEYAHTINSRDHRLGRQMIAAGASMVLGTHPHVVQPLYEETTPEGRQTLIVASTGNFVSNMRRLPRRAGLIMHLEFCRAHPLAGEARAPLVLSRARATPTLMVFDGQGPRLTLNAGDVGGAHKVSRNHTLSLIGRERLYQVPPNVQWSDTRKPLQRRFARADVSNLAQAQPTPATLGKGIPKAHAIAEKTASTSQLALRSPWHAFAP